ncbi:hypothetical protein UlMin_004385 [Ulmus minor]
MNTFDSQRQDFSLKRRWQEMRSRNLVNGGANRPFMGNSNNNINPKSNNSLQGFPAGLLLDHHQDDVVSTVVPAVTVVLEGRSICQRISLHKHASYQSLALALRRMFVDEGGDLDLDLDLSNAIPGHLIAYEDMENDLLLAGDLNWKDFVRVAKRIRILPAKTSSRRDRSTGA